MEGQLSATSPTSDTDLDPIRQKILQLVRDAFGEGGVTSAQINPDQEEDDSDVGDLFKKKKRVKEKGKGKEGEGSKKKERKDDSEGKEKSKEKDPRLPGRMA